MKKIVRRRNSARTKDGMRKEYDLAQGVRGKYAARLRQLANVVVLAPDVAEAFPDSKSVNDALRLLVRLAQRRVN